MWYINWYFFSITLKKTFSSFHYDFDICEIIQSYPGILLFNRNTLTIESESNTYFITIICIWTMFIKKSNEIKKERKFQSLDKAYNLHIPNIYAVKQILRSLLKWFGEVSKLQIFKARFHPQYRNIAITYLCSLIKINQFGLNKGCWRHIISIRRKTNEIPSFYKNKWHDESCFTFWILIGLCVCLSVQMKYFHIFFFQFAHYGGLYRRVDGL